MKITFLAENNTRIDKYLLGEPALYLLIEYAGKTILFDTGYSDVFLKNATSLNINLDKLTDVVISHSHDDHTGGLKYLHANKHVIFTAHPNIFDEKLDELGNSYGCPLKNTELEKMFSLNLTQKPYYITQSIVFLGEIPNNNSSEIDDSALVCIKNDALFIITGCSHSGIINVVNYAKEVTQIKNIAAIVGGMHLLDKTSEEIVQISEFFKKENISYLAPCHCCDLNSKFILAKNNEIAEICVGDTIIF